MHGMTVTSTVDLFTQHLLFEPSGTVRADERRMAGGGDEWRLAMFHAETDDEVHADQWEQHPNADEAVCCVSGGIRLHLRGAQPGTPDDVVQLGPGRAVVIPRGRWHRLELREPSDLLVVTLRRGTQLEKATGRADRLAGP